MAYTIGIDDGHGAKTAGKRTPILEKDLVMDGKVYKKGSYIPENDFNKRLMKLIQKELTNNGIKYIELAPGDEDISLQNRVKTANNNKVDLVVSIHANAISSTWQDKAQGLVVIHTANCSTKSITLANNCYNYLSKDVKWYKDGATRYKVRKDTDISGYTLYILKNTTMPAILIEYGFMDNINDVELMVSDKFAKDCAVATARGICDTLGIKYKGTVENSSTGNTEPVNETSVIYRICIGSYSVQENANKAKEEAIKKDYKDAYILKEGNYYRVVIGAYSVKTNAEKAKEEAIKKGYAGAFIVKK